jgi:hypothetical protein
LIIYSRQDDIIPFANGIRLFECAQAPQKFLEIHGNHNEGFLVSGKIYTDANREFIDDSFAAIDRG